MTRNFAFHLARALASHASSNKYPTRSVEYMLAWIMISWALMLTLPITLHGTQFSALLTLAPQWAWAAFGLMVGAFRLFALIRNGAWHKSPWLRFIGASIGFQFWFSVTLLNLIAIKNGAFVYPILGCFPVFVFFEGYSCFRCGQDARHANTVARPPG